MLDSILNNSRLTPILISRFFLDLRRVATMGAEGTIYDNPAQDVPSRVHFEEHKERHNSVRADIMEVIDRNSRRSRSGSGDTASTLIELQEVSMTSPAIRSASD